MGYFVGNLGYYEGDRCDLDDAEVPRRPSAAHEWNGDQWIEDSRKAALATIAALEADQVRRLTPRGDREFRMALFVSAGLQTHPAYLALKAIDDQVRAERAKL